MLAIWAARVHALTACTPALHCQTATYESASRRVHVVSSAKHQVL